MKPVPIYTIKEAVETIRLVLESDYLALLTKAKKAQEVIHDEFCSGEIHHKFCVELAQILPDEGTDFSADRTAL